MDKDKKPQLTPEEREQLRSNLKAKINANKLCRLNKGARAQTLHGMQEKIQQEMGTDFDFQKLAEQMTRKK
jgi:hypothetical protein